MEDASGPREDPLALRAALVAIAAVAVAFRFYALGRLPGINGDEAWCGVLGQRVGHPNPDGWLTSSGNLPGPFHLPLLALLARVAPPSFAALRLPTVLASLAQAALTFFVARRHLGRAAAQIATLLTLALPAAIAHARFGWDPSYAGLVAAPAVHFALQRRLAPTLALFVLGVWVHPTNAFLAPFLAAAAIGAGPDRRREARRAAVATAAAAAALIVIVAAKGAFTTFELRPSGLLARVIDPRQWGRFALAYVRLLDGDTVLAFVTGEGWGAARPAVDAAVAAALVGLVARGAPRLARRPRELGLVAGWLVTLAAFALVAGPEALQPGLERYGLVLLVPTILAVAVLAREASARPIVPVVATSVVAVALLVGFWRGYFVRLERTGSTGHVAFWTGPVEPKAAAWARISAGAPAGASVVAEGWWLRWPLTYLAFGSRAGVRDDARLDEHPPAPGELLVGFAGGPLEERVKLSGAATLEAEIPGAGGRTVLRVWRAHGK